MSDVPHLSQKALHTIDIFSVFVRAFWNGNTSQYEEGRLHEIHHLVQLKEIQICTFRAGQPHFSRLHNHFHYHSGDLSSLFECWLK